MGNTKPNPDVRLAATIRSQHGPFTRQQALEAGFSPSSIKRRVAAGRWLRLHRGVFCEVAVPPTLGRDTAAAVLACGPSAVASHRTAARWWGLDVPQPDRPEVTVRAPSRSRPLECSSTRPPG